MTTVTIDELRHLEETVSFFVEDKEKWASSPTEEGGLGLKSYPVFEMAGYDSESWKSDILLRIAIIEHKETLDKLNSFKESFEIPLRRRSKIYTFE